LLLFLALDVILLALSGIVPQALAHESRAPYDVRAIGDG
jgi:hypothetical protein